MKVLAITAANVRRMMRDRSNIFFVFIFPLAIILLVGAQFGGDVDPIVGVYQADNAALADAIVDELEAEERLDTTIYTRRESRLTAVERGHVQAGVLLPTGMDDSAAAAEPVDVGFVARVGGFGAQLQAVVSSAVARVMTPITAAQFATATVDGASVDAAVATSTELAGVAPGFAVSTTTIGDALFPESLGRFDLGAAQQLVLFVFLTALAGSAALILTRKLGISKRMMSTPTSVRTIVLGEGTGRWGTAMVQGLYIMFATLQFATT